MSPSGSKKPLTILHTNDFHNRLTPEQYDSLHSLFTRLPDPRLLLDAGDAGGSTNVTFRIAGEPILDRMSDLGYSAMTVGNRDFHVSRLGLRSKLFRARFPILCANIRPSKERLSGSEPSRDDPLADSVATDEPAIRSHVVLEIDNWRVLVFGLTVPMVTERMWERKLSAYIFDPPLRAAERILPRLIERVKPDLTIALTHIGLRLDRELAATNLGVDLIIGGHSHETLPEGERMGDSLIVQAGSHGRYAGIVEAELADGRPMLKARIATL